MAATFVRLVVLALCALVLIFHISPHLSRTALVPLTSFGQDTTSQGAAQCSVGSSGDQDCDEESKGTVTVADVKASRPTASAQPGRIDYPQGYGRFEISNPDSPYSQETYESAGDDDEHAKGGSKSVKESGVADYIARLEKWVPYNQKYKTLNPVIWQTFREEPASNSIPYLSWTDKNKSPWSRTFVSEANRAAYLQGLTRNMPFLNDTYHALPSRILQLDFLRYLSLFHDGGVYADIDTQCLQPVEAWYAACRADSPPNRPEGKHGGGGGAGEGALQPGLLVGVDFDVAKDPDYDDVDGRQVGLANYVMAAHAGHPALARVIAEIVHAVATGGGTRDAQRQGEAAAAAAVSRLTGGRAWTDAVVAHVQSTVQGFRPERDLVGLHKARMAGDVCVLPIAAFGSGQRAYRASPEASDPDVVVPVMVKHFRMHLWQ